jgi:hypothetical protein
MMSLSWVLLSPEISVRVEFLRRNPIFGQPMNIAQPEPIQAASAEIRG